MESKTHLWHKFPVVTDHVVKLAVRVTLNSLLVLVTSQKPYGRHWFLSCESEEEEQGYLPLFLIVWLFLKYRLTGILPGPTHLA